VLILFQHAGQPGHDDAFAALGDGGWFIDEVAKIVFVDFFLSPRSRPGWNHNQIRACSCNIALIKSAATASRR
jgi:hypothetical protein